MKEVAIARVNNVNLLVCQDPEQLVPIRPICDALGVDFASQYQRIKRDEIYSSTVVVTTMVASDGNDREMVALPMEFIFGWLMSIDTSRVNEDARPAVIQYKVECHKALYQYFAGAQTFLKEKQEIIDQMTQKYFESQVKFRESRKTMYENKKELQDVLAIDYETWISNSRQLIIPFPASDQPIEPEDGEDPSNE